MSNTYLIEKEEVLDSDSGNEGLPTREELIEDLRTDMSIATPGMGFPTIKRIYDIIAGNYVKETESNKDLNMYEIVLGRTYGKALEELRKKSRESDISIVEGGVIKQPSLLENLEIRINCLETKFNTDGSKRSAEERAVLFLNYLDSRSAVAYSNSKKNGKNDEFMYIPDSRELVNLPADFNHPFVPIDYSLLNGIKLRKNDAIYNERMPRELIPKHKFWLTVVDGNEKFLEDYVKAFDEACRITGRNLPNKLMGVYLRDLNNISENHLRELCVVSLGGNSGALGGWFLLSNDARFARVSQNQPRKPEGEAERVRE